MTVINLAERLKNKNITKADFGNAIDVSPSTVTAILGGDRKLQLDEVQKAAKALDQSVIAILASLLEGFDIENEVDSEINTLRFASELADELIEKTGKEFDTQRRQDLIETIYKLERINQAQGNKSLDVDSIQIALSLSMGS